MPENWRKEIANLFLLLFSFIVSGITWTLAPDMIPVHWNMAGQVDSYANKFEALVLLPAIALATYITSLFLLGFPRRFDRQRFGSGYQAIVTVSIAFLAGSNLMMALTALGIQVDMTRVISLMMGLVMIFIGNYLGKLRPNLMAGIRTPWTMLSQESWTKTHRVGGKALLLSGTSVVVFSLVSPSRVVPYTAGLLMIDVVVLALYSYLLWKADPYKRRLFAR